MEQDDGEYIMNKKIILLVFCLVCIFCLTNSVAREKEDIIIKGKIIEIEEDKHIIQVRDRNYIVIAVFIDDGKTTEPEPGFFSDLKVGDKVKIAEGNRSGSFWEAKRVVLITEDRDMDD